jgi:hypothetical protein
MVNVSTKYKNLPFIKNLIAGGEYVRLIEVELNIGTWYFVQDTDNSIYLLFDSDIYSMDGMFAFKTPFALTYLRLKILAFLKSRHLISTIQTIMFDSTAIRPSLITRRY